MTRDTTPRDFDSRAATWDEKPARVKLAADIAAAMAEELAFTPDMDILDFGCGTGLLTLALRPLVRSVTGADTSRGMLDVLTAKAAQAGLNGVTVRHLSPEGGGMPQGPFDRVVSSMTLHHVEDPGLVLSLLYGLVRPAGMVCIADLDLDQGLFHEDNQGVYHFGFGRDHMQAMFAEAGFERVRTRDGATVTRPGNDGVARDFGVFLCIGRRPI